MIHASRYVNHHYHRNSPIPTILILTILEILTILILTILRILTILILILTILTFLTILKPEKWLLRNLGGLPGARERNLLLENP